MQIFTGKVLKMTENPEEGYVSVELEVFDLWKGKLPVKTTVLTGLHDGNCRFNFTVDETYLVYAKNLSMYAARSLSTHMCFRTALYSAAKPDITILGTPKKRFRK